MAGQHKSSYTLVLPFVVLLWVMTVSCDPAFEPLKENNHYHFSISGYLDASADTQWVRVMPVRDSVLYKPKPIDATVTLEEVESNKSTTMNDSLFSYRGGGGSHAHIFWTTMDLEPEHTYRITAKRSDGMFSSAEIILPADFPTPMVRMGVRTEDFDVYDIVYIHKSIDRLGDLQTIYHGRDSSTGEFLVRSFSHFQPEDTSHNSLDYHTIFIDSDEDDLTSFGTVNKRLIFVAAVGPDYHIFSAIDDNVINLPEGVSNIENGVGYLAGIVSKTIPYKSCFDGIELAPCPTDPPPW